MSGSPSETTVAPAGLSTAGRYLVLTCAFLGWMFAGFLLSITPLAMQPAAIDLLARNDLLDRGHYKQYTDAATEEKTARAQASKANLPPPEPRLTSQQRADLDRWDDLVGRWFAWLQAAFLFGAATGGLVFGRLGDAIGRSKAMGLSILAYSGMCALGPFAQTPLQLAIVWFLACMGVGGMWPNGVALVSEAWAALSRTMAAGVIGTSANIGIFMLATIAVRQKVSTGHWHWMFYVGATPLLLGLFVLAFVPESPRWLAARRAVTAVGGSAKAASTWEIFHRPLLRVTIVGIVLATVPMIGNWGSINWMVPWAAQAGEGIVSPAQVQQAKSLTGIVGSLIGGWVGGLLGRRTTYFGVSFICLALAQYVFWFVVPTDRLFLLWVAVIGLFSGLYFGWLPLCLPELYPTRVRSTGAGVCFNFGRILTAVTVFGAGAIMRLFDGKFDRMGRATSLFFLVGMIAVLFTPDTSRKQLDD